MKHPQLFKPSGEKTHKSLKVEQRWSNLGCLLTQNLGSTGKQSLETRLSERRYRVSVKSCDRGSWSDWSSAVFVCSDPFWWNGCPTWSLAKRPRTEWSPGTPKPLAGAGQESQFLPGPENCEINGPWENKPKGNEATNKEPQEEERVWRIQ